MNLNQKKFVGIMAILFYLAMILIVSIFYGFSEAVRLVTSLIVFTGITVGGFAFIIGLGWWASDKYDELGEYG